MLLIDLEQERIIDDDEIKAELANAKPYKQWLARTQIVLEDLPAGAAHQPRSDVSLLDRQQAFGYTQEDLKILMTPMAVTGQEAIGSMGNDAPISALSDKPKLLYTYFKQNFAQVTNPPIDSIREELVMSLVSFIGPRPNLFDIEGQGRRKRLEVRQPILDQRGPGEDPRHRRHGRQPVPVRDARHHLRRRPPASTAWRRRSTRSAPGAEAAVRAGINIIILSDRMVGPDRVPIPALLATAGVHHHLIREGLRTSVGLVVETGDAREVHHFCVLAGYGAEAINPYLAFETLAAMARDLPEDVDADEIDPPLHQGDRQGPAQGHGQDGHLDLPVLLRRPDLRRDRPVERLRRPLFHRHRHHHRGRRLRRDRRRDGPPPSRRLRQFAGSAPSRSRSAATMPSASAANSMSGAPRPSRRCSMPCAAMPATSIASSRGW